MKREILFSVTASDCRFDYFKGTGKGGQKRNKTESGVRCTHLDSGAVGKSDDTRSQHQNKRIAFERMAYSSDFKAWHKIEVARRTGALVEAGKKTDIAMRLGNLLIEENSTGKWRSF